MAPLPGGASRGETMSLKSRVCVVTGGGSGIGKAVAIKFAAEGAVVALCARTVSSLKSVAQEIRDAGGQAEIYPLDVSDYEAVQKTAKAIEAKLGRVDVLVNSAGGGVIHKRTLTTTPEDM